MPPHEGMETARDVGVILAAAGSGVRFGGKKQLIRLAGKPLLFHSLEVFERIRDVIEVAIVVPEEDREDVARLLAGRGAAGAGAPVISLVRGGARRQDSVQRGLEALTGRSRWVLVHDAARPLLREAEVESVIAAVRAHGAAAIGHPAGDSIKEESGGKVRRDLPRERIWQVQTPQGASAELLRSALERAGRDGITATDEAGLLERIGVAAALVEGSRENLKITYPADLDLAEHLLGRRTRASI